MSFNATATGAARSNWKGKASAHAGTETAPAGNHPAVLVALIDMGTQTTDFSGERKRQHRAYFVWELTTEKVAGTRGTNHVAAIDLTLSLHEKAKLRQWVEAWRGRKLADDEEFDFTKLLGKPCLLTVTHTERGYARIGSVSAVPKGLVVPDAQRTPVLWSLEDPPEAIPDWVPYLFGRKIVEHIAECDELNGRTAPHAAEAEDDAAEPTGSPADEVPF